MNENRQKMTNDEIFNNSIQFTINGENMECLMHNLSSDYSQGFNFSYIYDEVVEANYLVREDIYRQRSELYKFPRSVKYYLITKEYE